MTETERKIKAGNRWPLSNVNYDSLKRKLWKGPKGLHPHY